MSSGLKPVRLRAATVAFLAAASVLVSGCQEEPGSAGKANATAEEKPAIRLPEVIPVPDPELGRADLLEAAARAASAYAAGLDDSEAQAELAGRRFTFKLRFGCGGQTETLDETPLGWSFDEKDRTLKVRAEPNLVRPGKDDEKQPEDASTADVEAIEGFWIPRPWILTDTCPAHPLKDTPIDTPPSVGIAQYFTAATSRVQRRSGRAYEVTKRVDSSAAPGDEGFNLVLHGRLNAPPGGKIIQCAATGADVRPQCIIAAEFDEISLHDPGTGASLGDWR